MWSHLQIYDPRERWLVGAADLALAPVGWVRARQAPAGPIRRVLLLRLERIGDLLMVLDAVRDVRRRLPEAEIDLAVGSWNAPLAALVPDVTRLEIADVPWLARDTGGLGWPTLVARARGWRRRRYDLAINFEPDIRSNLLAWLSGAAWRVGYSTGGGRAFLSDAVAYEPASHTADNALRLVARAFGGITPAVPAPGASPRLTLPKAADNEAGRILAGLARPLVGVHVSGGRESKQWHVDRFADAARALARQDGATIILTGSAADRPLVDEARRRLAGLRVVDVAGRLDLPALAALLGQLDLFVTGDTGPMHLAAAMGTPLVALFGPSNPARYGPRGPIQRIIRIDLPCSPCGRVRLPPERCRGHVPDCLDGIHAATVVAAARELLAGRAARG